MATLVEFPVTQCTQEDLVLDPVGAIAAFRDSNLRAHENYIIKQDELLGEGSYSSVYEAVHSTSGAVVVSKLTDLSLKTHSRCHKNEVQAFQRLGSHPTLVTFHDTYILESEIGVIILEKLSPLNLDEYIERHGRLSIFEALNVFKQLVSAVEFMHDKFVSPRDLKAENIAIDANTRKVKIFDLGLAMVIDPKKDGTFPHVNVSTGSPLFMAPEVLACKPHNSFAHDVWCLGQIFYTMLVGKSPFHWCSTLNELRDELLVFRKVRYPSSIDFKTKELLKGMLEFDPKLRLDIKAVKETVDTFFSFQHKSESKVAGNDA